MAAFQDLEPQAKDSVIGQVEGEFRSLLARQKLDSADLVGKAVELLLALSNTTFRSKAAVLLLDASFYYSRIGRGPHGLRLAKRILESVVSADDIPTLPKAS